MSGAIERSTLICLSARDCIELITDLVLSTTGSQRGLQRAHERRRRYWTFEHGDVSAGLEQRAQVGHAQWRNAPADEHDNRDVRPGGLVEQDIDNAVRGLERERFLR